MTRAIRTLWSLEHVKYLDSPLRSLSNNFSCCLYSLRSYRVFELVIKNLIGAPKIYLQFPMRSGPYSVYWDPRKEFKPIMILR